MEAYVLRSSSISMVFCCPVAGLAKHNFMLETRARGEEGRRSACQLERREGGCAWCPARLATSAAPPTALSCPYYCSNPFEPIRARAEGRAEAQSLVLQFSCSSRGEREGGCRGGSLSVRGRRWE